jgi:hypothetical protein
MQVPAYQVNSGRDQASPVTSGASSSVLPTRADIRAGQTAGQAAASQVDGQTNAAATANPAGPGAGNAQPAQDKVKPANLRGDRAGAGLTRVQE